MGILFVIAGIVKIVCNIAGILFVIAGILFVVAGILFVIAGILFVIAGILFVIAGIVGKNRTRRSPASWPAPPTATCPPGVSGVSVTPSVELDSKTGLLR